jgi:hypothetical protein
MIICDLMIDKNRGWFAAGMLMTIPQVFLFQRRKKGQVMVLCNFGVILSAFMTRKK